MVDKVKDVVDDMTDASGDRDDKVRRNEKVAGVIPGVFTQVWNYGRNSRCVHSGLDAGAVEYKTRSRPRGQGWCSAAGPRVRSEAPSPSRVSSFA